MRMRMRMRRRPAAAHTHTRTHAPTLTAHGSRPQHFSHSIALATFSHSITRYGNQKQFLALLLPLCQHRHLQTRRQIAPPKPLPACYLAYTFVLHTTRRSPFCVYVCLCVCVCCATALRFDGSHMHTHKHVCLCVCVSRTLAKS